MITYYSDVLRELTHAELDDNFRWVNDNPRSMIVPPQLLPQTIYVENTKNYYVGYSIDDNYISSQETPTGYAKFTMNNDNGSIHTAYLTPPVADGPYVDTFFVETKLEGDFVYTESVNIPSPAGDVIIESEFSQPFDCYDMVTTYTPVYNAVVTYENSSEYTPAVTVLARYNVREWDISDYLYAYRPVAGDWDRVMVLDKELIAYNYEAIDMFYNGTEYRYWNFNSDLVDLSTDAEVFPAGVRSSTYSHQGGYSLKVSDGEAVGALTDTFGRANITSYYSLSFWVYFNTFPPAEGTEGQLERTYLFGFSNAAGTRHVDFYYQASYWPLLIDDRRLYMRVNVDGGQGTSILIQSNSQTVSWKHIEITVGEIAGHLVVRMNGSQVGSGWVGDFLYGVTDTPSPELPCPYNASVDMYMDEIRVFSPVLTDEERSFLRSPTGRAKYTLDFPPIADNLVTNIAYTSYTTPQILTQPIDGEFNIVELFTSPESVDDINFKMYYPRTFMRDTNSRVKIIFGESSIDNLEIRGFKV